MPADRSCITKAVIPAAGLGTRLRPLTSITPKELLPLGSRPTAEYIIEELQAVGIQDIIFVVSQHKAGIKDYFRDSACDGKVRVSYVLQEEQMGLAHAILQAEEAVGGEHFIVALGDTVIVSAAGMLPLGRLVKAYQSNPAFAAVLVEKVPIMEAYRFGMVKPVGGISESFEIDGLVEKPRVEESPSEYAIGGRYIFGPEIFDWIRRTPTGALGEYQITDSMRVGMEAGNRIWCAPILQGEYRYDIGDFNTYCEAFVAVCMHDPRLSRVVGMAVEEHRRSNS